MVIYHLYYDRKLVMAVFVFFFSQKRVKDLIHIHFNMSDQDRLVRQCAVNLLSGCIVVLFANVWD